MTERSIEKERQNTVGRDVSIEEIYTFDQAFYNYKEIIHLCKQMLRGNRSSWNA